MLAKKKKQKSRFVDGIIALLLGMFVSYLGLVGLKSLLVGGDYLYNVLNASKTLEWLVESETYMKMISLAIWVGVFVVFMSASSKKDSGYKDASSHGAYGNAQFSELDDVRDDGFIAPRKESVFSEKNPLVTLGASEGIILGREDDELIIIPPNSKLDNRNVYVVGSSGSAKGQAFVINNIVNNKQETIIVTDPKGELYDLTSDIKRDQGYKVYQIDFLNLKGNRYNPLDYVKNDFESIKIATTISKNSGKDVKQDFFFNTAKDLLTGLIIFVTDGERFEKPSISREVKRLFNKISEDKDFLQNLCEEIGEEHPSYQYFKDASIATGNTRTSILQSFAQQTSIFSLKDVAKLTEDSDINFYDLQEEKSILYVKIPVTDNPVPALTATFFDQLIDTLYSIGDQNGAKLKIPTIMMFDEFANIGQLNKYDNVLSTCRGYDLAMITVVQDFAQMEKVYGKEMSRIIVNNHDTTLFLRTKDVETAKFFEALAGDTTIKYNTRNRNGSNTLLDLVMGTKSSSSTGLSETYVKKPLTSASELMNMNPPDKCYIYMTGHVIEAKKAYQSLIYKNFFTKQDGIGNNGRPKFVYCYPENREAYMKKFGLKAKEEIVNLEKASDEASRSIDNRLAKEKDTFVKNEIEKESYNETMESIVTDFMTTIKRKENVTKELSKEEKVTSHQRERAITTENDIVSDPVELVSFLEATKIKESDVLIEKLENKKSLYKELNLYEEDDIGKNNGSEESNYDDELPM